jgi:hypothetical protein
MSWSAILGIWAATAGWREKFGKKLKAGAKKTGNFLMTNWKMMILLAAFIILIVFAYQKGQEDGSSSCDEAWIKQYNDTVAEFNDRLKRLQSDSTTVGKVVDKASNDAANDISKIDQDLQKEADRQAAAKDKNAINVGCPATDLNDELPAEFWESWNKINEAGAKNNPYK